jgi:hypothetical protein
LNPTRTYVPRIGYKELVEEGREDQQILWWKIIWKLKFPTKNKIFMWLSLHNKAPTWDVLQKRNFIGTRIVLSMSPRKRNYSSSHVGMSIL